MRVDKITMSTSVEARVPFLDQDLVEFGMDAAVAHETARPKIGKYVFKKADARLAARRGDRPQENGVRRPGPGVALGPFGAFARERLLGTGTELFDADVVRRLLDEQASGRANWSQHLWVLLNFVMWYEHWILGRSL